MGEERVQSEKQDRARAEEARPPTATSGATECVDMIFSSMTNCVVYGQPWYYIHGAQL